MRLGTASTTLEQRTRPDAPSSGDSDTDDHGQTLSTVGFVVRWLSLSSTRCEERVLASASNLCATFKPARDRVTVHCTPLNADSFLLVATCSDLSITPTQLWPGRQVKSGNSFEQESKVEASLSPRRVVIASRRSPSSIEVAHRGHAPVGAARDVVKLCSGVRVLPTSFLALQGCLLWAQKLTPVRPSLSLFCSNDVTRCRSHPTV